jgi:hypothetical protein
MAGGVPAATLGGMTNHTELFPAAPSDPAAAGTPAPVRARLRSAFVAALLCALVGGGLLGIAALAFGSWGELEVRVLLTTVLLGAYSVLCLGCLPVLGTRRAPVGRLGVGACSVALLLGLVLIWLVADNDGGEGALTLFRAFWVAAVAAFALAHVAMLLGAARDPRGAAQAVLSATVAAVAVVAAMLAAVAISPDVAADGYWRMLGVFAILDVVGTVVVPVLSRARRAAGLSS